MNLRSPIVSMILLGTLAAQKSFAAEAVDIGSRRELFVDHYLIDELSGVHLRLQEPRHGGVAVRFDRPWEQRFAFYTTVLKDGDVYRMYYRGQMSPYRYTCYAESPDGIHWTKPDLGLVEVDGSTENNVILLNGLQFCPFIDTRPGVSAGERYKANLRDQLGPRSLIGYVSADGAHWQQIRPEPIVPFSLPNNFDSQNTMFFSEAEGRYVLYARHMVGGRRATARATSKDFMNWSVQTPMTYSDTGTTAPSQHLYTNQTQAYFRAPHIYISLPGRFQSGRRVLTDAQAARIGVDASGGGAGDCSDGVLLTTRAGTTRYDFTFRESFVRPGIGHGNWTSRTNYPALGVVQTGPHEMSLYVQRSYGQKTAYLERMTLRLDGFASVHAPYEGGRMLTKPLVFSGTRLEINYATSAASGIRVAIQDASGGPIPGFTLDECVEIIGDEIKRVVRWRGGSDLSKLAGRPIRLELAMKDADLCSIRFAALTASQ